MHPSRRRQLTIILFGFLSLVLVLQQGRVCDVRYMKTYVGSFSSWIEHVNVMGLFVLLCHSISVVGYNFLRQFLIFRRWEGSSQTSQTNSSSMIPLPFSFISHFSLHWQAICFVLRYFHTIIAISFCRIEQWTNTRHSPRSSLGFIIVLNVQMWNFMSKKKSCVVLNE